MFNILKKKKNKKENPDADSAKDKEKSYEKEIESNINVYVMPERFRVAHKQKSNAKVMGALIIIAGVVFLIVISALLYFYLIKKKPPVSEPTAVSTDIKDIKDKPQIKEIKKEDKKKPAAVPAEKDPEKSYARVKAELDKTETFDDFERLIMKYGSKSRVKEFKKEKKQVENMPDSFKNNIVSLVIQQTMPKLSEIGDIKENIKGNIAALSAVTKDLSKKGSIIMEREDNIWKLGSEGWENTKEEKKVIKIDPIEPAVFSSGADNDGDGLTDKEEGAIGSNPNSPDGDGDGYSDLSEIMNLYNPAGEGKLEDGAAVKKYKNNTYGYGLIYPAGWKINKIGGDDGVIFKSDDNQFIQVITQLNTNAQPIDEWYKQQFNVSVISDSKRVSGDSWNGIRNDDGLIIYLTDSGQAYIYTITYNFGEQAILEYKNIFEMMVKSFKVG